VVLAIPANEDLVNLTYWAITIYGYPFQGGSVIPRFFDFTTRLAIGFGWTTLHRLHNACQLEHAVRFGLFRFRSPLLSEYLFLEVLRCFTSLGLLPVSCEAGYPVFQRDGFPHSGIAGSKVVRTYPTLNAAYHALHRLRMPRHPHMRP
jgi:hypothetical protein